MSFQHLQVQYSGRSQLAEAGPVIQHNICDTGGRKKVEGHSIRLQVDVGEALLLLPCSCAAPWTVTVMLWKNQAALLH